MKAEREREPMHVKNLGTLDAQSDRSEGQSQIREGIRGKEFTVTHQAALRQHQGYYCGKDDAGQTEARVKGRMCTAQKEGKSKKDPPTS